MRRSGAKKIALRRNAIVVIGINPSYDVTTFRWRRMRWNELPRPLAALSTPSASRDLTAVVVFSVIGLLASLLFVLFFPDGLLAFVAQVP